MLRLIARSTSNARGLLPLTRASIVFSTLGSQRMKTDSASAEWTPPPRIEDLYSTCDGNKFSGINRPTAGARDDKEVPRGSAKFQLYSLGTPNGQKVGILLEELGIDYDAWRIKIWEGDQFSKGFVEINPNSKIPCAVDYDTKSGKPMRLFESAAIMLYLADKYKKFIPQDPEARAECLNWVFWQMGGQGPMTGNYGHFMVYAPNNEVSARNYGVARYGMEVQRLCSVLNQHLEGKKYIMGDEYTIADMICLPWFSQIRTGYKHTSGVGANEFLNAAQYSNLQRWADELKARPAVVRGMQVCTKNTGKPWLVTDDQAKL